MGHPRRLLLASGNAAKLTALRRAVGGAAVIVSCVEPNDPAPEEGTSVEANAAAKARRASRELPGELVVATDGGLLVPALGGSWIPAHTRRFAGAAASNRGRAEALLARAAGLDGADRWIGWREALAVARNGRIVAEWAAEGTDGLLAREVDPTGIEEAGFWVPAIWLCPEFGGRRLAALTAADLAVRDDHWPRLGRDLRGFLASLPPESEGRTESPG